MSPTLNYRQLLAQIRQFYFQQHRMPSFAELAQLFHYTSKGAVRYVIQQLVKKGLISQDEKGHLIPTQILNQYPLLGNIQAGFPSPAEEILLDTLSFDQYLVHNPNATFLVKVRGESMIEAGIMPGDIVIVDRHKKAQLGDIVLAEVDQAWTMKYLAKKANQICLLPANPKYFPIYPSTELTIGGVVVGVVRKY